MAFLKTWHLSWQLDKRTYRLLYFWQKESTVTNTTLQTSIFATYGLSFPFSCFRKRLHVSIYILLKQNSIPAASPPTPRAQPCHWKISSLPAKPDQLGSAGYSSQQVAQRAGELRGVLVPSRVHNRVQTGKRWSKASKLLTFQAGISRQ